jgi:hypothetical protein
VESHRWRTASISIGAAALVALTVGILTAWLLRGVNVSTEFILFAVSLPAALVAGALAPFVESMLARRSRVR